MAPGCELSVVITTRNDDFGTEMLPRLQLFVENLLTLGHRHGLRAEIVLVEWNPPVGPRISEVLKPRFQSEHIPVRFIEVPPDVHRRYRNSDVLPLFQMIAKNVGIRRARGRFVLCTNQDVLFSSELIVLAISAMRRSASSTDVVTVPMALAMRSASSDLLASATKRSSTV